MSQQHWSNDPAYRCLRHVAMLVAIVLVTGCSTVVPLMPTPTVYLGQSAKPLFLDIPADSKKPSIDLLYITDRAPGTEADKLPYSADRSRSMAFGSVTVGFGEGIDWSTLVAQSTVSKRSVPLELTLGPTTELGRFPPIAYDLAVTPEGVTRAPAVVEAHEKAAAKLQAEVTRRLAAAPRKEVVLFVHGYHNTFQDASLTMGELCHFLGREFVCAIFTWPAGGSRGLFFGYNVDRESGEFAVHHLKQAIRIIADTPGVERIHLLAHSRGTDVLISALRELNIEAYVTGTLLEPRFKIRNVVLMSPDLDFDVAAAKIFGIFSDPDIPYGKAPDPWVVFPTSKFRLTVYTSTGDKALGVAEYLMGSLRRLGRLDETKLSKEQLAASPPLAGFAAFVQVTNRSGFIGHSYFLSDPAVSSDLVAVVRYGLRPGDPGRPLEEISRPYWKIVPPRVDTE
ncbi:alpha/beta hydrolase [Cupriavidus necator]